jgi:hypothetical protein
LVGQRELLFPEPTFQEIDPEYDGDVEQQYGCEYDRYNHGNACTNPHDQRVTENPSGNTRERQQEYIDQQ